MLHDLQRYLSSGRLVEVIYMDCQGLITQRRLKLHRIEGDCLKAYCFSRRSIRTFAISQILALASVSLMKGA